MSIEVFFQQNQLHPYDLLGELCYENRFTGIVDNYPPRRQAVPFNQIEVYQGDDRTFRVFVKDKSLQNIDLTGATGLLTVSETRASIANVFQKSTAVPAEGMIGAADEGEMFFYIVPDDTDDIDVRQYVFDIKVTLSNSKTYTILAGLINLKQSLTV